MRARRRLLAILLGTAVAFLAAEATLRLTLPPVDLHSLSGVGQDFNPMEGWAQVEAFSAYRPRAGRYMQVKTVNTGGYLSTPEIEEKTAGGLRVAFLGGSSTAGTIPVLPDDQTIPWSAAELLREHLGEVDFVNGAVPGFSTFESYGRLWSRIRFLEPDVVVLNHGWNEMYYFRNAAAARSWRARADGSWGFEERLPVLLHRIAPHPIDPYIEWSSLLCRVRRALFAEPLEGEVGGARELAPDFDPKALDVFRTNLRLFLAAQAPLGFRLYVVKQPTLIVAGLPARLRERCGYRLHGFDHDAHVRAFAALYAVIDGEVPADRVIDLTDLSGDPDLLLDHVHPTAEGAGRIAERIAAHLLRELEPAAPR